MRLLDAGFLAGVKVRPEAVPSHLRACRGRRRGEPSMSIYPPSSSMSLGSREVQTQCRRSEEHVGRMPSAPPSTHGPSGVGRTDHEPPSTVERDRKAASPLGLVRIFSCQGTVPLGWRLAPPFHLRGGGGNPRPPADPTPAGNRADAVDHRGGVYEDQPLRADSLIDLSDPHCRGIRPKRPLPHGPFEAAPNGPQCPQIDEDIEIDTRCPRGG